MALALLMADEDCPTVDVPPISEQALSARSADANVRGAEMRFMGRWKWTKRWRV